MPSLRAIVRYGYAPFMMLGLIAGAYWVVSELAVAQNNPWAYLWLAPLLALAYATAFAAERTAPFFDEWNDHHEHGDNPTNLFHILVYEMQSINGILLIPLFVYLWPFDAGWWPTQWPLWTQFLVAYIISDFVFMFMHYLSHRFAPLWRLHAVHHGVGRLYGFNGVMRHPLHQVIDMVVGSLPLVLMGMPIPVAVLLGFAISVTLIVQHSNVDARLGPLQKHLSIGRVHHLHHVNWGTEGDCNFGLLLTCWDRMFGTFHEKPPREITAKDLGVDEIPNFPKSYIEQFLLPLHYKPGQGEPERYRKVEEPVVAPAPLTPAQEARRIVDAAE